MTAFGDSDAHISAYYRGCLLPYTWTLGPTVEDGSQEAVFVRERYLWYRPYVGDLLLVPLGLNVSIWPVLAAAVAGLGAIVHRGLRDGASSG